MLDPHEFANADGSVRGASQACAHHRRPIHTGQSVRVTQQWLHLLAGVALDGEEPICILFFSKGTKANRGCLKVDAYLNNNTCVATSHHHMVRVATPAQQLSMPNVHGPQRTRLGLRSTRRGPMVVILAILPVSLDVATATLQLYPGDPCACACRGAAGGCSDEGFGPDAAPTHGTDTVRGRGGHHHSGRQCRGHEALQGVGAHSVARLVDRVLGQLALRVDTEDGGLVEAEGTGQDRMRGRLPLHDPCQRSDI